MALQVNNGETRDWISELPDCIIVAILTLLGTRDAIKTSILSHRWRYLWTLRRANLKFELGNIQKFDDDLYSVEFIPRKRDFVKHGDRIMHFYEGRSIRSLKVAFFLDFENASNIDRWISIAIAARVEQLELLLSNKPYFWPPLIVPEDKLYQFPYWLFSRASVSSVLKYLHLQACSLMGQGDFGGLRYLTTLKLENVAVADDFVALLFSNCSVLEGLTLISCDSITKLHVVGSSLRLMHLIVLTCINIEDVKISSPNLTTFEFVGKVVKMALLEAPSLAKMSLSTTFCDSAPSYALPFTNLSRLETLILDMDPKKVERMPGSLTSFRSLKKLELIYLRHKKHEGQEDLSWVLSILYASPLLQSLTFGFFARDFEENQTIRTQNLGGITHNQLKYFEMGGCVGNRYEIEFAKFVLKAATKLERMVITPFARYYRGDGEWYDLGSCPSWYESHRDMVHGLLHDEVPVGVQFTVL